MARRPGFGHACPIAQFLKRPLHHSSKSLSISMVCICAFSLQVLTLQPESGFAKAHMGFILKDQPESMEEAVRMLREGVQSEDEGTQDGRFFLHLGDLLIRQGKTDEVSSLASSLLSDAVLINITQGLAGCSVYPA